MLVTKLVCRSSKLERKSLANFIDEHRASSFVTSLDNVNPASSFVCLRRSSLLIKTHAVSIYVFTVGAQHAAPAQNAMLHHPEKHQRRSIRLKHYDYSQCGAYFITICTQNHKYILGTISYEQMWLSPSGKIVLDAWGAIPIHFSNVILDSWVIMPNHLHGIVTLKENLAGTACCAPTEKPDTNRQQRINKPLPRSLPTIIRSFKSAATKRMNELRKTPGQLFWQRNYYEHIIRDEAELNRIREYIQNNPITWHLDRENPESSNYNLNHDVYWKDVFQT